MAKRKVGASPSKTQTKKQHGPKRNMFHGVNKCMRIDFGQAGVLTKYNDFESFALSCMDRGARNFHKEMWFEFSVLSRAEQNEYLKNIKEHEKNCASSAKKSLTKGKK